MTERTREISITGIILLTVMILVSNQVLDGERQVLTYNQALIAIQRLDTAILDYSADIGTPPTSLQGLITNTELSPLWRGPYAKPRELISPDGHKYCYQLFYSSDGVHSITIGSERSLCR